jgi:hypothetical protein
MKGAHVRRLEHFTGETQNLRTSSAFTDWQDGERASRNEFSESCCFDQQKADRMCTDMVSVLRYFMYNPWNQTTITNLVKVWIKVHTTKTLDSFALHTFIEALDDFQLEHQKNPKPEVWSYISSGYTYDDE